MQAEHRCPSKTVDEHIVEIVSDSGEGAQTCGQIFADLLARNGNGIWTVEIIPAEIEPPKRSRAGASGYITKQQPPGELLKAIRQVLDSRVYVSKEVSENLLRRLSGKPQANRSPMEILTDREFEILRFIGEGKSLKEIAWQLHITGKTVAVHSANIREKLRLQSTAQLIRFAVQFEARDTTSD